MAKDLKAKQKQFQLSNIKKDWEYELIFVVDNEKPYTANIKFVEEKNNDVAVTVKFDNEFVFDQNTKTFSMKTDFNKIQEWIYKSITTMANL